MDLLKKWPTDCINGQIIFKKAVWTKQKILYGSKISQEKQKQRAKCLNQKLSGASSHLYDGTVVSWGVFLGCDDMWRPVGQPVVNGHHEGVFEELRQEEQAEQEEPCRGQVGAAGAPGDGSSLAHYLWQVVIIFTLHRFLWSWNRDEVQC